MIFKNGDPFLLVKLNRNKRVSYDVGGRGGDVYEINCDILSWNDRGSHQQRLQ